MSDAADAMGLPDQPIPPVPPSPFIGRGAGNAYFVPPSTPLNSRGQPYSPRLTSMPPEQRANEAKSEAANKALMDAVRAGKMTPEQARAQLYGGGATADTAVPASAGGAAVAPAASGGGGLRAALKKQWIDAGFPDNFAEGMMRRFNVESGFDPHAVGDNGTSFGIPQFHADRAKRLFAFAAAQGKSPADPFVQNAMAIHDYQGGDQIATHHRQEIEAAKTPEEAERLATKYFFRPAEGPHLPVGPHLVNGPFNDMAQEIVNQWRAQKPAMDEAIREAKDLHSFSRAMAEKWMTESDHPPKNMREAWSQWGGVAGALALFGGMFGGPRMIGALNAAGTMMQAANSADQRAYDTAYQHWKDHLDQGLKAIALINKEASDIIADSKLNYDQIIGQLDVLAKSAGVQQKLDPQSVENVTKQIELATRQADLIKANNVAADARRVDASLQAKAEAWVADPANASRVVTDAQGNKMPPADVLGRLHGEAEREVKGTGIVPVGTERDFVQTALETAATKKGSPLTADERNTVSAQAHSDWAKARTEGQQEAGVALSQKIYGDDTVDMVAQSFVAGSERSMVGLARQNVGLYTMARVWKRIGELLSDEEAKEFQQVYGRAPDKDEQKVLNEDRGRRLALAQAEFQGIRAGERTAFTRAAGLVTAAAEAKQFTPQALDASKKVDRYRYRDLNAIALAVKERTGDENVIAFHVANTALADAFAQVIGRGNTAMTDAARAQAMSLLDKRWSEGQYETAVATINREIDAAQKAPEEVIKRFREGFLQRQIAAPAAPVGAVQPGAAAPLSGTPKYTVGQIIEHGGKKYRVTGGDLSGDPDVELVK